MNRPGSSQGHYKMLGLTNDNMVKRARNHGIISRNSILIRDYVAQRFEIKGLFFTIPVFLVR